MRRQLFVIMEVWQIHKTTNYFNTKQYSRIWKNLILFSAECVQRDKSTDIICLEYCIQELE